MCDLHVVSLWCFIDIISTHRYLLPRGCFASPTRRRRIASSNSRFKKSTRLFRHLVSLIRRFTSSTRRFTGEFD